MKIIGEVPREEIPPRKQYTPIMAEIREALKSVNGGALKIEFETHAAARTSRVTLSRVYDVAQRGRVLYVSHKQGVNALRMGVRRSSIERGPRG